MNININAVVQHCTKCGSEDLEILTIKSEEVSIKHNSFVILCNKCGSEILEDKIKLNEIRGVNFWIEND